MAPSLENTGGNQLAAKQIFAFKNIYLIVIFIYFLA